MISPTNVEENSNMENTTESLVQDDKNTNEDTSTTSNSKNNNNNSSTLFDSILFRDTPGAPLSYDEDDAFSLLLASSEKLTTPHPKDYQKVDRMGFTTTPIQRRNPSVSSMVGKTIGGGGLLGKLGSSTGAFSPLRPKVVMKISIHEEVSSTQEKMSDLDDITSHMNIDGRANAQIISSNAGAVNPPLKVYIEDPDYPDDDRFVLNRNFIKETVNDATTNDDNGGGGNKDDDDGNDNGNHNKKRKNERLNLLMIPKAVTGEIPLASWQRNVTKRFMPVLLQTKILKTGPNHQKCMVAIQLRSNLKNKGPLLNLTIVIAVPPTVLSSTLDLKEGSNGSYDALKRVITYKLDELPVGNSHMFAFEVDAVLTTLPREELPKFPILLRCKSKEDTVSSVEVRLEGGVKGHQVSLTVEKVSSFQLLHRLPA